MPALPLTLAVAHGLAPPAPVRVWHLTDVHTDPYYVAGSDASGCFCETTASCGTCGSHCVLQRNATLAALKWGSSEGNCATPKSLYESALSFMATEAPDASMVYFTGDFSEAGATSGCDGSGAGKVAQRQLLDIMHYDWHTLTKAFPHAKLIGSFGNHDSSPGDVYYGDERQAWLYENVTESLWGVGLEPSDAVPLKRGGYYAVQVLEGLTVVSLNINLWVTQNPEATNPNSSAAAEGERQLLWLEATLATVEARGDVAHLLGHQPPDGSNAWVAGLWPRFASVVARHRTTVMGLFWGHVHTDQWSIVRDCREVNATDGYVETTGIKWCSGGGDYAPGDAFGAGVDGICPLLPAEWSVDQRGVPACEAVCDKEASCVGFTLEFATKGAECCFRTGSTASKPPDPASKNRCYEKPPQLACDGAPAAVMLPGPSLTEGYPAKNPAVRLLEFDPVTFVLTEVRTFTADLHAANAPGGSLKWGLEYDFRQQFGMADLTPSSFDNLSARLAEEDSPLWARYKGMGDGALFCSSYSSKTAPFPPRSPCASCEGECKATFLALLNGTNLSG